MKSFDSRTYSLNDFVEWEKKKGALILNPRFQRRSVWTDKAKSFLMDTVVRGKPIPKVFIRQVINVSNKTTVREVVDGQQRLRTILSYISDGFYISKRQNEEFGGKFFSQLPENIQNQILAYEVSVDLLINMPDSEVLDIFSRLNSYAVILNEQDGHKYNNYWTEQGILTSKQIMRMLEVNLVADLIIAMLEGIKSKKQIKKYYDIYEQDGKFPYQLDKLEKRFDAIISTISNLYIEGLKDTEFRRPHIYYSLFTAVTHRVFGLPGLPQALPKGKLLKNTSAIRNRLDQVEGIFSQEDSTKLTVVERTFLEDSRRATTDEAVRLRRTKFLVKLIG